MTTWTVRTTTIDGDELSEISGNAADFTAAHNAGTEQIRQHIDRYEAAGGDLLPWYCLTIDNQPTAFIATGRRHDRRPDHDSARAELARIQAVE